MGKLIITTSRCPSNSLIRFTKTLVNVFPKSLKINRGIKFFSSLFSFCLIHESSDFIIVYEKRGTPLSLIISHLPTGPSIFFGLSNVVTQNSSSRFFLFSNSPHVLLVNLDSPVSKRITKILSLIFPKPNQKSQRIVSFVGEKNKIIFSHHWFQIKGPKQGDIMLKKLSPSFDMQPYKILLGTLFTKEKEVEWIITPFINKKRKKTFLY
jgi:U3 small nucleolar ribonucleoprotein protein IMP4